MLMNTALSELKSKNFSFATIGVGMDEENNQQMYGHMENHVFVACACTDFIARTRKQRVRRDLRVELIVGKHANGA